MHSVEGPVNATETTSPANRTATLEWHSHNGVGDPELHGGTPVEVRFRDGDTACGVVYDWDQNWQWAGSEEGMVAAGAIVAWRHRSAEDRKVKALPRGLLDTSVEPNDVSAGEMSEEDSEETRRFNETMSSKTPRQILAAVRRLAPRNRKPNWSLAMVVFGVGSTYGRRICKEAGIDPDAKTLTAYDVGGPDPLR